MSRTDELRMIARVAQLYYEDRLKQAQISERLHVSQATVSRLLKRAEEEGVVRVTIAAPRGTYPEFESALRQRYHLNEAIVAECFEDREEAILSAIGAAAAHYFETTMSEGDVIGISSWSASLLRMVDAIHPDQAAARRARRPDPGRPRRPVRAKPRDPAHHPACVAHRGRGPVASGARGRQFVGGAPRDARRRLCARRDRSVPPDDDRARRNRSAAALHHARPIPATLSQRKSCMISPGEAQSATSLCNSSIATARRCTDRSTIGSSASRLRTEIDAARHRRRRRRPQGRGDPRLSQGRPRQRARHRQVHGGKTSGAEDS